LGPLKKKKNPGALGTCPVCPLVKTALFIVWVVCVGLCIVFSRLTYLIIIIIIINRFV